MPFRATSGVPVFLTLSNFVDTRATRRGPCGENMSLQSALPLAALALVVAAILFAPASTSRCLAVRPHPLTSLC